jgi:ribosomal protein S18 acetylase RimI-like enzyme
LFDRNGSGVAVFEPVGVHPAFRGRGLATAAMIEAMRRLVDEGLRVARVGAAHINTSAIAAYSRAFDQVGLSSFWLGSP